MSDEVKIVDIDSEEYKRFLNDYQGYLSTFVSGFVTNLYSDGIITEVDAEKLKKYFASPDIFQKEIEDLAQYYYVSSGEIHQMYDLIEALPTLNYKIDSYDKVKNHDKYISLINKALHRVKHKRLTRDIIKQTATAGALVGMWLKDKNDLYAYIFDDLELVFPAYRKNGEWQCVVDLEYFSKLNEEFRKQELINLSPYVTNNDYKKYIENPEKYRYKELPQERTFVLRTGTLKRNQGLGTSWVTAGLFDVQHKKKLKDVERSIANKIINAVAVLTIGVNGNKDYNALTNLNLPPAVKRKIHNGVKSALEKGSKSGVKVVSIPDFAKLEFPDIKTDGLDGKKYESINMDIQTGYGLSSSILNGQGGNYATASINLETLYRRIAILLEDVEQEVYQKLINLILPANQKDNYYIEYDKKPPLSLKDKLNVLMKLNDKGWSTKHVIDNIDGITWESYLEQTIYETEVLNLQERIRPYKSSHTLNKNDVGRPEADSNNDNTNRSKTNDGNGLPR